MNERSVMFDQSCTTRKSISQIRPASSLSIERKWRWVNISLIKIMDWKIPSIWPDIFQLRRTNSVQYSTKYVLFARNYVIKQASEQMEENIWTFNPAMIDSSALLSSFLYSSCLVQQFCISNVMTHCLFVSLEKGNSFKLLLISTSSQ